MADTESARLIIEVVAGLIPGKDPDPAYTRRWAITSAEWADAVNADEDADEAHRFHTYLLLTGRAAQADEYARALRNPQRFNWVRTEWVWL